MLIRVARRTWWSLRTAGAGTLLCMSCCSKASMLGCTDASAASGTLARPGLVKIWLPQSSTTVSPEFIIGTLIILNYAGAVRKLQYRHGLA